MHPTYRYAHPNGYHAQRYRCPLLLPQATGQTCDHEQFLKGCGCKKDINDEAGGRARILMKRDSPLYHVIYDQRTSCERINSQAKELGIESGICSQWSIGCQFEYSDLFDYSCTCSQTGQIHQCCTSFQPERSSTNALVAPLERASQAI